MHDSEGSAVTTRGVFVSNADMDDRGDDSSSQGQSSETKSAVRIFTLEAHIVYMMGGVASTFYLFVLVHMFFLCFLLLIIVHIHTSQCLNSCLSHVRPNVLVHYHLTSLFLQQHFWPTHLVIVSLASCFIEGEFYKNWLIETHTFNEQILKYFTCKHLLHVISHKRCVILRQCWINILGFVKC